MASARAHIETLTATCCALDPRCDRGDAMQPVANAEVVTALELAAIRPERRGRRRLSGLTQPERDLYRWILQRFAAALPPSGEATRATALELGLDPDEALA